MTEIEIKLNRICRSCLKENVFMKPINTLWNEAIQFHDMFYFLIGIESTKSEAHLLNICEKCEQNLILSYSFKKQCIKSEEVLNRNWCIKIRNDVKQENPNDCYWQTKVLNSERQTEEADLKLIECKEITEEKQIESKQEENKDIKINSQKEIIEKKSTKKKKHRLNLDPNFRHCLRCNLKFPDLQAYQLHHRQIHRVPILCPLCGKMVSRQALEKHISTHTKSKDHLCTECGKCFTLSENLKKHWRIHTKDKRYTCEYCDEKFIHWNSKRSHIRTVHTGEKKYECSICGKKFAQSSNMFRHVRGSHTGELPHSCSYCGKKFVTSPELKNHIVTHTKEKNHVCEVCQKAFGTKKSLRTHTKIHTGEKNYLCTICSKAFTQAHVLRTHMKTHPDCIIPPPGVILSQKALNKPSNLLQSKCTDIASKQTEETLQLN